MIIFNKIKRVIERPERLMLGLQLRWAHYTNNQKLLVNSLYRLQLGKKLNLDSPRTFTEKLQWLKLYDHNPIYHKMVDKYEVKKFVAKRIGAQYIIPTLGIWDCFDDIDFEALPNQFVLKTTNGGGSSGVVICIDKSTLDKQTAKDKLERSLSNDIYKSMGEWAYKGVSKRILAEKFMSPVNSVIPVDLPDYKFFCFNGEPHYCQVIRDRNSKETIDFYDMEWNHLPFVGLNPIAQNGITPVAKPLHLNTMIDICRKLSKSLRFSRIDLYVIDNKEYFGEITLYPASGFGVFTPSEWNNTFGDLIKLDRNLIGGGKNKKEVIYAWAA